MSDYFAKGLLLSVEAQALPPLEDCSCQLVLETYQRGGETREVAYLLFQHPQLPPFSLDLDDASPLNAALHPLLLAHHPLAARLDPPLHSKLTVHVSGYRPAAPRMQLSLPLEDSCPSEDDLGVDLFQLEGSEEEESEDGAVDLTAENSGRVKAELIQIMKDPSSRRCKLKEIRSRLKRAGFNVPDAKLKVLLNETCLLSEKAKGYVVRPQFLTAEEREREERREQEEAAREKARKGSRKPSKKAGKK